MQVYRQIIGFFLGAGAYLFLSRVLDRAILLVVARWFWQSLFLTSAQSRFRVLHFLSLGWSLFPWFTFLALFIVSMHGSLSVFVLCGLAVMIARVFNSTVWSRRVDLFEDWLGEQGVLKKARPGWLKSYKRQLYEIVGNLSKHQVSAANETRYFDTSLGSVVLMLGLCFWALENAVLDLARILQILWFVFGLSAAIAFEFHRRLSVGASLRYVLVGLCFLFLNAHLQFLFLWPLIFVLAGTGVVRDLKRDLEREINPLSARRGSGELEIFDAQRIVRLRAVRDLGDTLVLGRPYKFLLTLRDVMASPSLRWSLARVDGALAIAILVIACLVRFHSF